MCIFLQNIIWIHVNFINRKFQYLSQRSGSRLLKLVVTGSILFWDKFFPHIIVFYNTNFVLYILINFSYKYKTLWSSV